MIKFSKWKVPLPGGQARRNKLLSWGAQPPKRARAGSCVDGPRLARENVACRTEVACSHVSGLFTQSLNDPNHSFTGHPFDTCR